MDSSPEYQELCEKAEEIQKQAPKESGTEEYPFYESSLFYLPQDDEIALFHHDNDEGRWMIGCYHQDTEGSIWLPRQNQLQEMILTNNLPDELCKTIGYFRDFVLGVTPQFGSYEQLWLAFVMLTLYHKKWDSTTGEWVMGC